MGLVGFPQSKGSRCLDLSLPYRKQICLGRHAGDSELKKVGTLTGQMAPGRQPKLEVGQVGRAWGRLIGQGLGVESDLFGVFGLLIGSVGWVSWSGLVGHWVIV